MDMHAEATLMCKLQMLCGRHLLVEAQSSWSVLNLREHVESDFGIPEYEQVFAHEGVALHNSKVLRSLPSVDSGACVELSFCRLFKPENISRLEAKNMWQGFLIHSCDDGLTVEGVNASKVARFAGLFEVARMIKRQADVPVNFTFPEVLNCVSALQETLPPKPMRHHEGHDWLLDIGRSPLLPSSHARPPLPVDD
eukprot:TRINITY_DN14437_c0_g4_i1.p1 TRINITY_DN14437_c0_g4~~TRINITY_DN14437_c0_g4_i1.p1  ORF type:complete len:196 (-),score=38.65 TRINITY_DN14437_c0_g4_i1:308-895(-)